MFLNHIFDHARNTPDKLAVINSGENISYHRFAIAIETARKSLMEAKLPDTGIILNITSNLYRDWVLLLAVRSLGLTTVSGSSWQSIEEIGFTGIRALVCYQSQTVAKETFLAAMPGCPVIELPDNLFDTNPRTPVPSALIEGRFGDHIIYTSGTSGTYKKLLYRGENIAPVIEKELEMRSGHIGPDDTYYLFSFGPWTAAGQKGPLALWYRGATVIFEQRQNWVEHFFDYTITNTFFVPSLMQHFEANAGKYHPNLTIMVGGGFLDTELARRVIEQLKCRLLISYGGSEFGAPLEQYVENDDDVVWLTPNSIAEFEIVDDEDIPVADGEEGFIRIRCDPIYPETYLDDPAATATHFRNGWFYTGDMAVRREDGRIRILGRVDDVINIAGRKIGIEPFERAAAGVLGVTNLCAFSQQDDQGNDLVVFVIEGEKLPDRLKLEKLAGNLKQSGKVRFSLIDKFPRGTNGMMKVNRRKVLELVRASWKAEASAENTA